MATKVREIDSTTKTHDPNCSICHRREDRRYMDEIWHKALERAKSNGSASVRIER